MTVGKYFHVGFNFQGEPPKEEALKAIFERADDWVKYAPNCWIIYTKESTLTWANRFHELSIHYTVLVFEIEISKHAGWAQQLVVDWLKKPRY